MYSFWHVDVEVVLTWANGVESNKVKAICVTRVSAEEQRVFEAKDLAGEQFYGDPFMFGNVVQQYGQLGTYYSRGRIFGGRNCVHWADGSITAQVDTIDLAEPTVREVREHFQPWLKKGALVRYRGEGCTHRETVIIGIVRELSVGGDDDECAVDNGVYLSWADGSSSARLSSVALSPLSDAERQQWDSEAWYRQGTIVRACPNGVHVFEGDEMWEGMSEHNRCWTGRVISQPNSDMKVAVSGPPLPTWAQPRRPEGYLVHIFNVLTERKLERQKFEGDWTPFLHTFLVAERWNRSDAEIESIGSLIESLSCR